jgi:hypothetical protein
LQPELFVNRLVGFFRRSIHPKPEGGGIIGMRTIFGVACREVYNQMKFR